MKLVSLILITFSFIAGANAACPNLSGEYVFAEHPWNGKVIVTQKACESISMRSEWPVDMSPTFPDGLQVFTTNYLPDGKAYEGMYQSLKLATADDYTFHITKFVDQGVSVVDYSGSQKECKLAHTFNYSNGNCKKSEKRLEYNKDLKKFVWRQIGNMWFPNGWNDDVFVLEKR